MEEKENKTPEVAEKETKAKKKENKPSFGERIGRFFRSYKSEIKKIVWCPWNQVRRNSLVVLVVVVACAAVICALDFAFSKGIIALGNLF